MSTCDPENGQTCTAGYPDNAVIKLLSTHSTVVETPGYLESEAKATSTILGIREYCVLAPGYRYLNVCQFRNCKLSFAFTEGFDVREEDNH